MVPPANGPIEHRAEANRLLEKALTEYPRAWLAIGDDAVTSDPNATSARLLLRGAHRQRSALDPATIKSMLGQIRSAMSARDYPTAIRLLTKLQRQPEFPERARVQELLGLARERSGQLAHAKAEYEEYLRAIPRARLPSASPCACGSCAPRPRNRNPGRSERGSSRWRSTAASRNCSATTARA